MAIPAAILALAAGRWWLTSDGDGEGEGERRGGGGPVPVETAPVETGPLSAVRELTGTLEPSARIVLAAEVAGTVLAVEAELADTVQPEQVLAVLDGRDSRQMAAAARASLAVARARAAAAESALATARRTLERAEALGERGIASQSSLDAARGMVAEAEATAAVADAEVARARAESTGAQLQVDRTRIRGRWSESSGPRRVASRDVDEGARVAVGDALFTLIDTDPLLFAVMVTPDDYGDIEDGQEVTLLTPDGRSVTGTVARIAPSFDAQSRQARVEIEVPNPEGDLRPGTFVRSRAVLRTLEGATLVPQIALTRRDGGDVVFALSDDGASVRIVPVRIVLRSEGKVAVEAPELSGRVVTLGQERLAEGTEVRLVEARGAEIADGEQRPTEPDG